MTTRVRRIAQAAFLLLLGLSAYLSLVPQPPRMVALSWDKLNHSLGYACLLLALDWGWSTGRGQWGKAALLLAYSGVLEIAQLWVPGREGSLWDLAANALGLLAVLALSPLLERTAFYRRLAEHPASDTPPPPQAP